jgi:hypothetical protein
MRQRRLAVAVIAAVLLATSPRGGAQEDPSRLGLPVTVLLSCDDGSTVTRQLSLGERQVRLADLPAGTVCTVRELDAPLLSVGGVDLSARVLPPVPAGGVSTADVLRIEGPELVVTPEVGRPGRTVEVSGTGFPPGATVRLDWDRGFSPGATVTASREGEIDLRLLVRSGDGLGERWLEAWVDGAVVAEDSHLVVIDAAIPGGPDNPDAYTR